MSAAVSSSVRNLAAPALKSVPRDHDPFTPRVLIIDSDIDVLRRLRALLSATGYRDIHIVTNPLFGLVQCCEIEPDVVIVDPRPSITHGHDILRDLVDLTSDGWFLPILVVTSDTSNVGKAEAFNRGACDYFTKPFDATRLICRLRQLTQLTALTRTMRKLTGSEPGPSPDERQAALDAAWLQVCKVSLDRESPSHVGAQLNELASECHSGRVASLVERIAHEMGTGSEFCDHLRHGAVVHDLGKVAVPDEILYKPRHLSANEFDIVKRHATIGARALTPAASLPIQVARNITRWHHERWDGTGYPSRLCCEQIPLEARITSVADAFDAMTSHRVYRRAISTEHALAKIREQSGRQFDPTIVQVLLDMFVASPEM